MIVNLKTAALNVKSSPLSTEITDRLPTHLLAPCRVSYSFKLENKQDYYLLTLKVYGAIEVICQRCLGQFVDNYLNETAIALCATESMAEKVLSDYETVVYNNDKIDLIDLITDELILYTAQNHATIDDCKQEIHPYLPNSFDDNEQI